METTGYLEEEWYKNLSKYERRMLESLIQAQRDIEEEQKKEGKTEKGIALIPIYDPVYSKEIQLKIDTLFIYNRFYFYKAKNPQETEEGETNESEE